MVKIIARRTGFGFQAALFSTPTLSDGAYAASDGEKNMRDAAAELKSVTLPMKGIVTKGRVSVTKTAILLLKTQQTISVITRDQMDRQTTTFVSNALNYTKSAFTHYPGSSNRNDEVVIRHFCYMTRNDLRENASSLKGASVQFNVNNLTMSPPAAEKRRVSTATNAACYPRSAIADNTWFSAPLAAHSHVAVGIFPFGRGEKLAPTPTRGT
ncbi:TonB-dependent receptor plug domain-containing protein [Xenorhabdus sp. SGI246]|uniref:TonB-dependent receptor plug domain-containing protein n=1 Tax=Xenorhabdus sp. SGI246 TaxID=3158263 RepID=UPI00349F18D0